jgi:hypothetical protein
MRLDDLRNSVDGLPELLAFDGSVEREAAALPRVAKDVPLS